MGLRCLCGLRGVGFGNQFFRKGTTEKLFRCYKRSCVFKYAMHIWRMDLPFEDVSSTLEVRIQKCDLWRLTNRFQLETWGDPRQNIPALMTLRHIVPQGFIYRNVIAYLDDIIIEHLPISRPAYLVYPEVVLANVNHWWEKKGTLLEIPGGICRL